MNKKANTNEINFTSKPTKEHLNKLIEEVRELNRLVENEETNSPELEQEAGNKLHFLLSILSKFGIDREPILGPVLNRMAEIDDEKVKLANEIKDLRNLMLKEKAKYEKQLSELKKPKKVKTAGHLIENILKGKRPQSNQLSLYDQLLEPTQNKILQEGVSVDYINTKGEGINLTKGELKILNSLVTLLHNKSQNTDFKKDNYYTGEGVDLATYKTPQGDITLRRPKISFSLYDITLEYKGGERVSGRDIEIVSKLLFDLAYQVEKKVLIKYTRSEKISADKTRVNTIEHFTNLIDIYNLTREDFVEGNQIDSKKEVIVSLHPVFIDQIESKFIELPTNLTKRMIEANGSPNISEITQKFVYELYRAYSNRKKLSKDKDENPIYSIGQNTLFWKIATSYMNEKTGKSNRPQLTTEYVDKSIETAKKLGLLINYELKMGIAGELIYHFTLANEWD